MLDHRTSHAAGEFDRLVAEFISARKRLESDDFLLIVERAESPADEHVYRNYEQLLNVPWIEDPGLRRLLRAPKDKNDDGPLALFKRLAGEAWSWLPQQLARDVLSVAPEQERIHWSDWQKWIWLLWCDFAWTPNSEPDTNDWPGPAGVDIPPFGQSADLITALHLNTARPLAPHWLKSVLGEPDVATRAKKKRPGKHVSEEDDYARQKVADLWRHFKENYKTLRYSKPSKELFTQWGNAEHPATMPSDDPEEIKKLLDRQRKTRQPKSTEH